MPAKSAKDLRVYQQAYATAMEIFELSKTWPKDEKYSLIDQIRRSSRSVCANLREAWCKRSYEAHFRSKLTDVDAENSETDTWFDFAKDCGYLDAATHQRLVRQCQAVGKMTGAIIHSAKTFTPHPDH